MREGEGVEGIFSSHLLTQSLNFSINITDNIIVFICFQM